MCGVFLKWGTRFGVLSLRACKEDGSGSVQTKSSIELELRFKGLGAVLPALS